MSQLLEYIRNHKIQTLSVFILLPLLAVGIYLARNPTVFRPKASENDPRFRIEGEVDKARLGQPFKVSVFINPKGKTILSANIGLSYDPNKLELVPPVDSNFGVLGNFFQRDFNTPGTARAAWVASDGRTNTFLQNLSPLQAEFSFFRDLTFRVKGAGRTSITFLPLSTVTSVVPSGQPINNIGAPEGSFDVELGAPANQPTVEYIINPTSPVPNQNFTVTIRNRSEATGDIAMLLKEPTFVLGHPSRSNNSIKSYWAAGGDGTNQNQTTDPTFWRFNLPARPYTIQLVAGCDYSKPDPRGGPGPDCSGSNVVAYQELDVSVMDRRDPSPSPNSGGPPTAGVHFVINNGSVRDYARSKTLTDPNSALNTINLGLRAEYAFPNGALRDTNSSIIVMKTNAAGNAPAQDTSWNCASPNISRDIAGVRYCFIGQGSIAESTTSGALGSSIWSPGHSGVYKIIVEAIDKTTPTPNKCSGWRTAFGTDHPEVTATRQISRCSDSGDDALTITVNASGGTTATTPPVTATTPPVGSNPRQTSAWGIPIADLAPEKSVCRDAGVSEADIRAGKCLVTVDAQFRGFDTDDKKSPLYNTTFIIAHGRYAVVTNINPEERVRDSGGDVNIFNGKERLGNAPNHRYVLARGQIDLPDNQGGLATHREICEEGKRLGGGDYPPDVNGNKYCRIDVTSQFRGYDTDDVNAPGYNTMFVVGYGKYQLWSKVNSSGSRSKIAPQGEVSSLWPQLCNLKPANTPYCQIDSASHYKEMDTSDRNNPGHNVEQVTAYGKILIRSKIKSDNTRDTIAFADLGGSSGVMPEVCGSTGRCVPDEMSHYVGYDSDDKTNTFYNTDVVIKDSKLWVRKGLNPQPRDPHANISSGGGPGNSATVTYEIKQVDRVVNNPVASQPFDVIINSRSESTADIAMRIKPEGSSNWETAYASGGGGGNGTKWTFTKPVGSYSVQLVAGCVYGGALPVCEGSGIIGYSLLSIRVVDGSGSSPVDPPRNVTYTVKQFGQVVVPSAVLIESQPFDIVISNRSDNRANVAMRVRVHRNMVWGDWETVWATSGSGGDGTTWTFTKPRGRYEFQLAAGCNYQVNPPDCTVRESVDYIPRLELTLGPDRQGAQVTPIGGTLSANYTLSTQTPTANNQFTINFTRTDGSHYIAILVNDRPEWLSTGSQKDLILPSGTHTVRLVSNCDGAAYNAGRLECDNGTRYNGLQIRIP